jgi:hypothetical protein
LVDKFLFVPPAAVAESGADDGGDDEGLVVEKPLVKRVDEVDDSFFAVGDLPVAAD